MEKEYTPQYEAVHKKIMQILQLLPDAKVRHMLATVLTGAVAGRAIDDDSLGMTLARVAISQALEEMKIGPLESLPEGRSHDAAN